MAKVSKTCALCEKVVGDTFDAGHTDPSSRGVEMHRALSTDAEFNSMLSRLRLRPQTLEKIEGCVSAVRDALRPEELYVVGSVGKQTAIEQQHDLDLVVITSGGSDLSHINSMGGQLIEKGFSNVVVQKRKNRPERRKITAAYNDLNVDILPVESLSNASWAAGQVRHSEFFAQMSEWKRDVVRALKAWARLQLPLPGFLLEVVAFSLTESVSVRQGFVEAVRLLANQRPWLDPTNPQNDVGSDARLSALWPEVARYCEATLALAAGPAIPVDQVRWPRVSCAAAELGEVPFPDALLAPELVALAKTFSLAPQLAWGEETSHLQEWPETCLCGLANIERDGYGVYADFYFRCLPTTFGASDERRVKSTVRSSSLEDLLLELAAHASEEVIIDLPSDHDLLQVLLQYEPSGVPGIDGAYRWIDDAICSADWQHFQLRQGVGYRGEGVPAGHTRRMLLFPHAPFRCRMAWDCKITWAEDGSQRGYLIPRRRMALSIDT